MVDPVRFADFKPKAQRPAEIKFTKFHADRQREAQAEADERAKQADAGIPSDSAP